MTKKYAKSCFSVKKFISTSKRHVKHPFAGRNTQHEGLFPRVSEAHCGYTSLPEYVIMIERV